MTEKILKSRIVHKHDVAENWAKATGFCPKQGELIIYDDRYTDAEGNEVIVADCVRFKIGDGVTNVNDLPFMGEEDPKAIIDVVELPTENINEDMFYRLMAAKFVNNGEIFSTWICKCVETLPDVGEPCSDAEMSYVLGYYNISDNDVYGYVDDELGTLLGVPAGWYPIGALISSIGSDWGGVITDIKDDPKDGALRVLMEYVIYSYRDGWTPLKGIGWQGTGLNAEIFNRLNNIASGDFSHAEGCLTAATGHSSHVEGADNVARGDASHAEGGSTTANGDHSHAEGLMTYANGECSHAEGHGAIVNGNRAHAEGFETRADGNDAHAEGHSTIASGEYQHVQGKYNIEDTENKYAHIVGNGGNTPSNAHTLDWNGVGWFAGEVKVGGTGQDDENAKTLATTEYVESKANDLQPKSDDTLTTTDKTIVGAINELNGKVGDTSTLVQAVIDALPKYNGEVEDV